MTFARVRFRSDLLHMSYHKVLTHANAIALRVSHTPRPDIISRISDSLFGVPTALSD
jgi:hypothetical protein